MRIAVSLATVAAAAALAACGGGDSQGTQATGVPPEEWAGDVCTAVGSWLDDFIARSSELDSDAEGIGSLEDGRTLLTNFLEFTVDRTDELLADVEAAGQPDVDEGEAIASDFRANVLPLREALADALERARKQPRSASPSRRLGERSRAPSTISHASMTPRSSKAMLRQHAPNLRAKRHRPFTAASVQ